LFLLYPVPQYCGLFETVFVEWALPEGENESLQPFKSETDKTHIKNVELAYERLLPW
jgi:hypothetical protein